MKSHLSTRARLLITLMLAVAAMSGAASFFLVEGASLLLDVELVEAELYQGDTVNLSLKVTNMGVNEIEVHSIGVHPDWMPRLFFYRVDLSGRPARLLPGESWNSSLSFNVPGDIAPGPHLFNGRVQFKERDPSGQPGPLQGWMGGNLTVVIYDAYKRLFDQLAPIVLEKISSAKEQHLELSNALALLAQAEREYNLAAAEAQAENYREAMAHLQASSSLVDQAVQHEASYWRQEALNITSRVEKRLTSLLQRQPESPEAEELASQAAGKLSQAQDLIRSGQYKTAITRAREADQRVEQALLREEEFQRRKTEFYMVVASVAVAAATVAFVAAITYRRGPRERKAAELKREGKRIPSRGDFSWPT